MHRRHLILAGIVAIFLAAGWVAGDYFMGKQPGEDWEAFADVNSDYGDEDEDIAMSDVAIVEVSVPLLGEAATRGEAVFNEKCASCHGANAAGREGFGPPLVHPIYSPKHHGDLEFVIAVNTGVKAHHWQFGNMVPIDDVANSDLSDIINYVRALQKANGIN